MPEGVKCDMCSMTNTRSRITLIEKAPRNLICVVKCYSELGPLKLMCKMHIPAAIDIGNYITKNLVAREKHDKRIERLQAAGEEVDEKSKEFEPKKYIYELYAVIFHIGKVISQGHYTAAVKDMQRSEWYYCDDRNVYSINDPVDEKALEDSLKTPYMLFYRKRVRCLPKHTGVSDLHSEQYSYKRLEARHDTAKERYL